MDIKVYQPLPKLETMYTEGEDAKPLPPKEGRSTIQLRTNAGTVSTPIWQVTELYVLTVEDLTVQMSKLRNRYEAEIKKLNHIITTEQQKIKILKEQLAQITAEAKVKLQEARTKQDQFIRTCSATLDTALEQKESEGASIMQIILNLIEENQSRIEKIERQTKGKIIQ